MKKLVTLLANKEIAKEIFDAFFDVVETITVETVEGEDILEDLFNNDEDCDCDDDVCDCDDDDEVEDDD